MNARIKRWSNSLVNVESKIQQDSTIEDASRSEKITVSPVTQQKFALNDLLAGITEKNLHDEINTGISVGSEIG